MYRGANVGKGTEKVPMSKDAGHLYGTTGLPSSGGLANLSRVRRATVREENFPEGQSFLQHLKNFQTMRTKLFGLMKTKMELFGLNAKRQ